MHRMPGRDLYGCGGVGELHGVRCRELQGHQWVGELHGVPFAHKLCFEKR